MDIILGGKKSHTDHPLLAIFLEYSWHNRTVEEKLVPKAVVCVVLHVCRSSSHLCVHVQTGHCLSHGSVRLLGLILVSCPIAVMKH